MSDLALTPEEEFWTNVDVRDMRECWRWKDSESYGVFSNNGESVPAHRFAWSCTYGEIPRGLLVLHGCDNKWCVNPRHLRLGTHEDNNRDKAVFTRAQAAIESARRKTALRADEIREATTAAATEPCVVPKIDGPLSPLPFGDVVRKLRTAKGWTMRVLAEALDCPPSCISDWENGRSGTPLSNLPRVAAVLGCEVADLMVRTRVVDSSVHDSNVTTNDSTRCNCVHADCSADGTEKKSANAESQKEISNGGC